jgi:predicted component of type VI protein secretion system
MSSLAHFSTKLSNGGVSATSLRNSGRGLIKEFIAQVLEGSLTLGRDADQMISARLAQIDHLVSIQLNEILHNSPVPEAGE